MIHSVTVINYLGEGLEMVLTKPKESGFRIDNIDGLGPPSADINTTELATSDGALYNSARASSRNITIHAVLEPLPTIEDTRHKSYKYFPVKKPCTLVFNTDNRYCTIDGYIESNEPDIFSKEESIQVSIICPFPYFKSIGTISILFYGIDPLFEFPFSNESLTEPLLEFGNIKDYTDQNIIYNGDVETGVTIKMHAIGKVKNISIYKIETREIMRINTDKILASTGSEFDVGDEIIISTVRENPYVTLLRGGLYINILNTINRDASWFQLTKGDNVFTYTAEEGVANLEFKMEYNILYEGV